MRRWFGDCLRSYSPWALDLSNVDVLAVLCPLLLGLLSCSSLWGFFLCVVSVVEVVVLLFFRLLFFVVFLAAFPCFPVGVLAPGSLAGSRGSLGLAAALSCPPRVLRSRVLSSRSSSMVFCRFRRGFVFCPFSRHFPSCGVPARWKDLRHVVLTFAASSFPSWRVASEF